MLHLLSVVVTTPLSAQVHPCVIYYTYVPCVLMLCDVLYCIMDQ